MQVFNDIAPHRSSARNARHIPHGLSREIAHPHAYRIAVRVADRPVIAHGFTGPSLDCSPSACGQWAGKSERERACGRIGENIGNDEARLSTQYLPPRTALI